MHRLLIDYIALAIQHGEATLEGNYKTGNKVHSRMIKVIDRIKIENIEVRQEFFALMGHENDSVKIWTATTLLKSVEKEATDALKSVAINNESIIGFTARTTIDVWSKGMLTT